MRNFSPMLNSMLQQKTIQILKPFQPEHIGFLGSFSRGENTPKSDLDILVKFQKRLSLLQFVQFEQFLSEQLGIKVNLVSENSSKKERFKKSIFNDLIRICK